MKTIIFIGQAPARPSSQHEIPGTYLHKWLKQIGLDEDTIAKSCLFYALTDVFPGSTKNGHAIPSKEAIEAHLPVLKQVIKDVRPDIIVPVGQMAIRYIIGTDEKLIDIIGKPYSLDPFQALGQEIPCIPLPHPSGRSVWNITHKDIVQQALHQLKSAIDHQNE